MKATGQFEVSLNPLELSIEGDSINTLGRLNISKHFSGDLTGTSGGEMLSCRSAKDGSAGYVALEHVTGTLGGLSGSFVLQHYGTMTHDSSHLTLMVVPDSGTGELTGLTGAMTIAIEDGRHYYDLDYELPSQ